MHNFYPTARTVQSTISCGIDDTLALIKYLCENCINNNGFLSLPVTNSINITNEYVNLINCNRDNKIIKLEKITLFYVLLLTINDITKKNADYFKKSLIIALRYNYDQLNKLYIDMMKNNINNINYIVDPNNNVFKSIMIGKYADFINYNRLNNNNNINKCLSDAIKSYKINNGVDVSNDQITKNFYDSYMHYLFNLDNDIDIGKIDYNIDDTMLFEFRFFGSRINEYYQKKNINTDENPINLIKQINAPKKERKDQSNENIINERMQKNMIMQMNDKRKNFIEEKRNISNVIVENDDRDDKDDNLKIFGGYYNKYFKYKQKYLNLKS